MTTPQWTSSITTSDLAARWRSVKRAVVLTHAKPDGDAIGSTLAVSRTLAALGVQVEIWYVGPMPRWAVNVIGSTPHQVFEPGAAITPANTNIQEPDLVIVVDTGTWSQTQECSAWLRSHRDRTMVIDHHVRGDLDMTDTRFLETTAASCTQILAPLCAEALKLDSPSRLPAQIAEPLYLGLATDTGWFRYSSVTPKTLRLAGDLIEAGVDHTRLYGFIEQQDVLSRWKLMGRALNGVRAFPVRDGHGGRIAILRLTCEDFEQTGGDRNDSGGFSDMLLSVSDIRAAATLTEQPGEGGSTIVKASVRSKPGPHAIDVNAAMAKLGGGGHVRAAGAKLTCSLDEAENRVLAALGAAE